VGAEPYWYYVPHEKNVGRALEKLRQQEFAAGRYLGAMDSLELVDLFPPGPRSPAPGPQHATIEEAVEAAEEGGTLSILDLTCISDDLEYGAVSRLPDDLLDAYYGTTQPTRAMADENQDYFDDLDRGQGIYFVIYESGQPSEILFAGYSCD